MLWLWILLAYLALLLAYGAGRLEAYFSALGTTVLVLAVILMSVVLYFIVTA